MEGEVTDLVENKKYNIILADPPWTYPDNGSTKNSRGLGQQYYDIMSIEELKKLTVFGEKIQNICEENCYCYMWTTGRRIRDSIEVLEAWGFEYFSIVFTWIKKNKKSNSLFWGMGQETRSNPEYVILGRKGKLNRLEKNVHSVIEAPIAKHSEKPIEIHKRIERLRGNLPRIELFARKKVKGWDSWGNQLDTQIQEVLQ